MEKLKRRLGKVCQYVSGISVLIQRAKRLFPIPHRWVADTFTGTGEGVFDLCDSPHDALWRVDSTHLLCHQRLWTHSTSAFPPSSVTGKADKLCAHLFTPIFASFSTLARRPTALQPLLFTPAGSGSANEAASAVRCGSGHTIAFLELSG